MLQLIKLIRAMFMDEKVMDELKLGDGIKKKRSSVKHV